SVLAGSALLAVVVICPLFPLMIKMLERSSCNHPGKRLRYRHEAAPLLTRYSDITLDPGCRTFQRVEDEHGASPGPPVSGLIGPVSRPRGSASACIHHHCITAAAARHHSSVHWRGARPS